jgi:hypothetical protein
MLVEFQWDVEQEVSCVFDLHRNIGGVSWFYDLTAGRATKGDGNLGVFAYHNRRNTGS